MWTGTATIDAIQSQGRWKVEFFCGDVVAGATAGYPMVPIKDLVQERKESLDPQAIPNDLLNYVGLENVQSLTGDLVNFEPKAGKEIKSKSKVFRENDILYGRLRPTLNKVYLAEAPISEGICSGEFIVLMPNLEKIMPNFLRTVLASRFVQSYVAGWQTGSALPRLQLSDLFKLSIPLPPMEVQEELEAQLINQTARRRQLTRELASMPQRIVDNVIAVLESGDPLSIGLESAD